MDLGSWGIFPFELGGDPGQEEKTYRALRSLVGIGGAAQNQDAVEDLWRRSKAIGLTAGTAFAERAVWQAWPHTAIDRIRNWEELLGTVPPVGATEQDRRELAASRYTNTARSDGPGMLEHLADVDGRLSLSDQPHESAATTYHGRAFEDFAATEPFGGGRKSTAYPNYSDDFVETVLFDIGGTLVPTPAHMRTIEEVRTLMAEIQPAWCTFRLVTSIGFVLDSSPLDVTGFGA